MAEDITTLRQQYEVLKSVEQHKNSLIEVSDCTLFESRSNSLLTVFRIF